MGFRPAVEVAQAISTAIADFPHEGVEKTVYIDNIRFVGDKLAVEKAAETFKKRCEDVHAIIGDETEAQQQDDFLGENYNYTAKTRKLTDKMVEKLVFMKQQLSECRALTYRQVAAFYGVLFYTSNVLRQSLAPYYNSLRWYRVTMSQITGWEDFCSLPQPDVKAEILKWIQITIDNEAVGMSDPKSLPFPDLTLYVDASNYGWACMSQSAFATKTLQGKWTARDRESFDVASSVVAEPLGVLRAVHGLIPKTAKTVKIFSDHIGLVFAGNKGYGKGETYNQMILQLQREYPNTTFIFEHIAGAINPVDKASRGLE